MRESVLSTMLLFTISMAASIQKFILTDTEYILKNIPAYQSANEQLQETTKKYQSEVEVITKEAQKMFQNYQVQSSILSAAQKAKKEDEIIVKEKSVAKLERKYLDSGGELAKMQEKLIDPIQGEAYGAIKGLSQLHRYDLVLDRVSVAGIIFADPRIDISDEVLRKSRYLN